MVDLLAGTLDMQSVRKYNSFALRCKVKKYDSVLSYLSPRYREKKQQDQLVVFVTLHDQLRLCQLWGFPETVTVAHRERKTLFS